MGGRLQDRVPQGWMDENNLGQCTVCSRLLSKRFGIACPRCRPSLNTSQPYSDGRPFPAGLPSWEDIFVSKTRTKLHVPKEAQQLLGQCLLAALAAVLRHNDLLAWAELLALPKMLLRSGGRGGKGHRRRAENETKQRCRNWLEGQRGQLWEREGRKGKPRRKKKEDEEDDR